MSHLIPLVSVVMPFHNTPISFMEEAIGSVLDQRYANFELLLVNDGSGEETTGVAKQVAARNPSKVQYLEHDERQKLGASASRQFALNHARGELVAFLDADDVWLPNKLEEQVPVLLSQPDAGMLYGNTLYWYSWIGNSQNQKRDFQPKLGVPLKSLIQPPTLLPLYLEGRAAVPCTCSILVRKEVLDASGGFETSFRSVYTDQVLYAKICLSSPVYVVDTCWDWYRQYPDSSTGIANQTGHMLEARKQFLNWLADYITKINCQHPSLQHSIRRELWLLETPQWLSSHRQMRSYVRWAKKWLLRAGIKRTD